MTFFSAARQRFKKATLILSIAMMVMLSLSACGADPQTQQNANTSKVQLDKLIAHAQNIGVPGTMLAPILQQEAQLSNTNAPLTLFNGQPATDYYANLTQRYQILELQI